MSALPIPGQYGFTCSNTTCGRANGHVEEFHKRAPVPRSLLWPATIVCGAVLVLSVVRLLLQCKRAVVPAACAVSMFLQMLESRSRLSTPADKCRFIVLAGAWGIAALCDCTAATDYWFALPLFSDPFQLMSLPLACASVLACSVGVLISSRLSRVDASFIKNVDAADQPEEQAPLVAPNISDTPEGFLTTPVDEPTLPASALFENCPYFGSTPSHDGRAQQQPRCQFPGCHFCSAEAVGSGIGGLPTVAAFNRWGTVDLFGGPAPCETASLDPLDGSSHGKRLSKSTNSNESNNHVDPALLKDSAFFPSHFRDGGLLAGFALFEGGRGTFRGPAATLSLDEGPPRVRLNEVCEWNYPCTMLVRSSQQLKGMWEERQDNDAPRSVSASTVASLENIPAGHESSAPGEEVRDRWSRCCPGPSPLLAEFIGDGDRETENLRAERHDTLAVEGKCGAAKESHAVFPQATQDATLSGSLPAGAQGLEAGWKPYLMMLGFQGSGGCKRDGCRMKRIGDVQWLEVMIVDEKGEANGGFKTCGASQVCDV